MYAALRNVDSQGVNYAINRGIVHCGMVNFESAILVKNLCLPCGEDVTAMLIGTIALPSSESKSTPPRV